MLVLKTIRNHEKFDSVLDTFNENTKAAKRLLRSTSKKDFFLGFSFLTTCFLTAVILCWLRISTQFLKDIPIRLLRSMQTKY